MTCPRLIEVALPIREISAESVRDKNIHHAHISHLHTWWARRPLAASRAVVFASLVPDPDHSDCPQAFRDAVQWLLKDKVPGDLRSYRRGRTVYTDNDPYRPYDALPDTLRNRLLTFIAKWSPEALEFDIGKRDKPPDKKYLLDDRSLVKWETCDPRSAQGQAVLAIARELISTAHDGAPPTVLDPFSGGGAIPLEVGRLGAKARANDYNPVAFLLLHATCHFPQQYGAPGKRMCEESTFGKRASGLKTVPNVLVHDFEHWAGVIQQDVSTRIGHLYPPGADGNPVLTYLWARTVACSNPSCRRQIPLLRSLLLCSKPGRRAAITMDPDTTTGTIAFGIAKGKDIKQTDGTKKQRGPVFCPFCKQTTTSEADLRTAGQSGSMGQQLIAVVTDNKGDKDYRTVESTDQEAFQHALELPAEIPGEYIVPEINGPSAMGDAGSHRSINLELYGLTRWGQLFNHRQLVVMQAYIKAFHESLMEMQESVEDEGYRQALATYLALWIDRIAVFNNAVCRWAPGSQIVKTPFSGQSVPMMWDYPEVNPFADTSGTPSTQLHYMVKVIEHEQVPEAVTYHGPTITKGSATELPHAEASCDYIVTDPPYGNSIAYADLSDFYYCWLKRTLSDVVPEAFTTPQTPKQLEATSHKHRHHGSQKTANAFYRDLLSKSFGECLRVLRPPELVSVMFAHQSTDAWVALLSALFEAGLSPDATWPIATEMPNTALALGTASLETSVTVVCRRRKVGAAASFRNVRKEIENVVAESVDRFWSYGFRGADLVVACYGPAVGVFGKYERVERADGTPVKIPELLELAREAARDAIAGEFRGDNLSTLYYVWANLYGIAEQAWDDARMVVQIGGDAENAMEVARGQGIFVVDGAKCRLALLADRGGRKNLGTDDDAPLIDTLHRAMVLWKAEQRSALVAFLTERGLIEDGPFWKLAQALFEVLPRDAEDWKLVSALLGERQTLRAEGTKVRKAAEEGRLF